MKVMSAVIGVLKEIEYESENKRRAEADLEARTRELGTLLGEQVARSLVASLLEERGSCRDCGETKFASSLSEDDLCIGCESKALRQ